MPGARDQRGDVLWLEVEVRRHGRQRGAAAEGDGGREPSSEAAGGGAEPARRGAEGSDPKKRVELAGLREEVAFISVEFRLSERTACKLLGVERSSYRYEPRPDRNIELREALVKLARQKPRYGYRRLHVVASTSRPRGQREACLPAVFGGGAGGSAQEAQAAGAGSCAWRRD